MRFIPPAILLGFIILNPGGDPFPWDMPLAEVTLAHLLIPVAGFMVMAMIFVILSD